MPNSFLSEMYFIALIMIFTVILTVSATYFFVRQYRREKKDSQKSKNQKPSEKDYVQK
jgi:heme/copper-type cytochrome/quinol oxidase subunit 2